MSTDYYNKNKNTIARKTKVRRDQYRLDALMAYGGEKPKCNCCGEKEIRFLCIDHIDNNGSSHRKEVGMNIMFWLKRNNYPDGFQVLCYNCNTAKGISGECPHITKKILKIMKENEI